MERKEAGERKEVSSTGLVSRVDVKFAYIANEKLGCVFVPPCAVLPDDCTDACLSRYIKAGDVVHFTAVRQQGKNECKWIATKVVLSANNAAYQIPPVKPESTKQVLTVTLVTETFAYGIIAELGMTFVPGAAFSSSEVQRLNSYLLPGDELLVVVRPQAPRSGCSWIATTATKLHAPTATRLHSSTVSTPLDTMSVAAPLIPNMFPGTPLISRMAAVLGPNPTDPQAASFVNAPLPIGLNVMTRPYRPAASLYPVSNLQFTPSVFRTSTFGWDEPCTSNTPQAFSEVVYGSTIPFRRRCVRFFAEGTLISVSEAMAYAEMAGGRQVECPILTWLGGNAGVIAATRLSEILHRGQKVYMDVGETDCFLRAMRWNTVPVGRPDRASSYTQTTITAEQMLLRCIGQETLGTLNLKEKAAFVFQFVGPCQNLMLHYDRKAA